MRTLRLSLLVGALVLAGAAPGAAEDRFSDGGGDVCVNAQFAPVDRSACSASDAHVDISEAAVDLRDDGSLFVIATVSGTDVDTLAVVLESDGVDTYSLSGDIRSGAVTVARIVDGAPVPVECEGGALVSALGGQGFVELTVVSGCLQAGTATAWSASILVQRIVAGDARSDYAPDLGTTAITVMAAPGGGGGGGGGVTPPTPVARDISGTCTDTSAVFDDVPGGTQGVHSAQINCIADRGIATGFPDGGYRPSVSVTAGQIAIFLDRTLTEGGTLLARATGCGDGAAGEALAVMIRAGVMTSCDGAFAASRSEMAGWVASSLRIAGVATASPTDWFTDDGTGAAASEHDALAELGIVIGTGNGRFAPDDELTRAQMGTFLARMLDTLLDA